MDYLFYGLIVLTVIAIGLAIGRLPGEIRLNGRQMDLAKRARKRRERTAHADQGKSEVLPQQQAILQRQLRDVPTPWGWPGSQARTAADRGRSASVSGSQGSPGSRHNWIDRLIAEKRTVEGSGYRAHGNAALRLMIEDRFGRSPQPQEMAFQKVRPPMLRDPQRPHDQMDNFPSGKAGVIAAGLARQNTANVAPQAPSVHKKAQHLGDIKTPWGW